MSADPDTETDTDEQPDPSLPFEAIVENRTLRTFVDVLQAVVDEAVVEATEDGLKARAVDAANVGMVYATLDADAFEHYRPAGKLGWNLGKLDNVLGLADADATIDLEVDPETRRLAIEAVSGRFSYDYTLIDPDAIRARPERPDIMENLTATVEIGADHLDRSASGADMVSDHLAYNADPDRGLVVTATGDTDSVEFVFDEDDLTDASIDADVTSLFALERVQEQVDRMEGSVTLHLGDEFPVVYQFTAAEDAIDAEYMIAPRIKAGGY